MTTHPTQLALVGAGLIGRRHAEVISAMAEADTACIVDPDDAAKDFAASLGVPHFASLPEMLARGGADGAIIATPNQLHVTQATACIEAGLPVLIEKPIADASALAAGLVAMAEDKGIPILVGHHRRHNPLIRAAKERLAAGELGRIVAVHGSFWLYKPDDYYDTEWRTRPGAGPVFINLIHDIDLMRHLVGEIASVQAITSNQTRGHEVEDTAAILLRFENGALGTITVSDTIVAPWSWELTAAENPAYPATGQSCYHIGGTAGSMEIPSGRTWTQTGQKSWWKPIEANDMNIAHADPLPLQIAHFCDVIAGHAAPLVPGREGVRSLQVVEAISRAAETGATVEIGPGN